MTKSGGAYMDWTMNLCFDLSTEESSIEGCSITANTTIKRDREYIEADYQNSQ